MIIIINLCKPHGIFKYTLKVARGEEKKYINYNVCFVKKVLKKDCFCKIFLLNKYILK